MEAVKLRPAKAKGRPQVTRERADALVQAIVAEARSINNDKQMAHYVERLSVFGSYLGDKAVLGDLDIAVGVAARWRPFTGEMEMMSARVARLYPPPPFIARDSMQLLFWPERVVYRRLRVGRGISLHPQGDLDTCGFEHRVIFQREWAAA